MTNYKNKVGKKCFKVTYVPEEARAYTIPYWPPYTLYVVAYTFGGAVYEANKRLCKAFPEGFTVTDVSLTGD